MATNVLSNEIRIFPSSKRATTSGHYGDNFVTEYNLSSIINKLLYQTGASTNSKNGFLITTNINSENPNEDNIEFNIGGYFIEVESWQDVIDAALETDSSSSTSYQNFVTFSSDSTGIYAEITIEENTGEQDLSYSRLAGSDGVSPSAKRTLSAGTEDGAVTAKNFKLKLLDVSTSPMLESYLYDGKYYRLAVKSRLRLVNLAIDDGEL